MLDEAPWTLEYGERTIPYSVAFVERETLEIAVHPDGAVRVRAPEGRSTEEVRAKVRSRARWITRQQDRFATLPTSAPRRYVSGETHRYLGRQYRLKVRRVDARAEESVRLIGPHFEVFAAGEGPKRTRELLDGWYRQRAEVKLAERYAACAEQVRPYGIEAPTLALRRMATRWGSYTRSGRVLLHPALVKAPVRCIDYVVLHELCHAAHPNHGPAFYGLLSRVLPDWRELKARLGAIPDLVGSETSSDRPIR